MKLRSLCCLNFFQTLSAKHVKLLKLHLTTLVTSLCTTFNTFIDLIWSNSKDIFRSRFDLIKLLLLLQPASTSSFFSSLEDCRRALLESWNIFFVSRKVVYFKATEKRQKKTFSNVFRFSKGVSLDMRNLRWLLVRSKGWTRHYEFLLCEAQNCCFHSAESWETQNSTLAIKSAYIDLFFFLSFRWGFSFSNFAEAPPPKGVTSFDKFAVTLCFDNSHPKEANTG